MFYSYLNDFFRFRKQRPFPPGGKVIDKPAKNILDILNGRRPALISRIGGVETEAISQFLKFGRVGAKQIQRLQKNAGFYLVDKTDLAKFVELNLNALSNTDLLAYWDCPGQYDLVNGLKADLRFTSLRNLEPFWREQDWLSTISGKKVCVVSPFVMTMQSQLENLAFIHPLLNLKDHDFSFVTAPQTNGGYEFQIGDPSWFERLMEMKEKIEDTAPDLVLIGSGSYGFPLGSILKDAGYSSVICGGALQLFFGIKGSRWDKREDYQAIYNKYWTRVSFNETPLGHNLIEDGCYW
jgi:hypothetical protein